MAPENRKHRSASLALRVTAFVGIATTLVFIAFELIVVRSLDHHFAEQDAGELSVVAESIQKVLQEQPAGTGAAELSRRLAGAVTGHHGVFFYVADATGKLLYTSQGPDLGRMAGSVSTLPSIKTESLQILEEHGRLYRAAVLQVDVSDPGGLKRYMVAVATTMESHLRYIANFQKTLWLTTLVVCCIALLSAWLAVRQGHAPLRKISAKIRGITSAHLHVRLRPQDVPIELAGLVESFNDMLGQIEDGFERLSNFSADIAHELRTPVTNLTTETQVALSKGRNVEEYREILYSNLEEFERMSKMIADMLFLAQTDNDLSRMEMTDVNLAAEAAGLFEYFEAWAEDCGVSLRLEGSAQPVKGDQLMLRRALGNLLSNAIRYTPRGGAVTVNLSIKGRTTVVSVENPGAGIPAEHLPRVFDRFYRVDPSRQRKGEGAGLGLAIVKSIVEAHHGQVGASSNNSITRFQFSIPASSGI